MIRKIKVYFVHAKSKLHAFYTVPENANRFVAVIIENMPDNQKRYLRQNHHRSCLRIDLLWRIDVFRDDNLINDGEALYENIRDGIIKKVGMFTTGVKLTILNMKLFEDILFNEVERYNLKKRSLENGNQTV